MEEEVDITNEREKALTALKYIIPLLEENNLKC